MVNRLLTLLTNIDPNALLIPANAADAIINQIMEVGSQLAPQFDLDPLDVLPLILDHAKQTLQDSLEEFLSVADPSFSVKGRIQPVILGIPFGPPQNEVELRLDKHGLQFGFDTTLLSLFNAATAVLSAMGVPDATVGMTVSLPIGDAILNALLAEGPLDPLEPNDPGWGIELQSSLRVAGFDVGTLKGLAIPPDANPATFLKDHIQLVYLAPDEPLDPTRIPIHNLEQYQALVSHGGILISGLMRAPKLLTDPLDVFTTLNLTPPENVLEYPGWLGKIANTLTQVVEPAQVQLFLPSLHKALLTSFDNACPAFDPNQDYTQAELAALCPEEGRVTITAAAAEILSDAYLAGNWDGKLLSIPLGKGRIEGTTEGLLVAMEEPLLGLELEFLVDTQIRTINGTRVEFPRAQGSLALDTTKSEQILESLSLPPHLLSQFGSASGTLRAFSPGFSSNPNEPDRLKRVGGFELSAQLNADLFDVFDATFDGALNSSGDYSFETSDLSYSFPAGIGIVSGNADFSIAGNSDSSDVDFQGSFSGSFKVGKTLVANVAATIDAFGCLQGSLTYLNGSGTLSLPDHALTPGACGPQLHVDDATFTESDADATHQVIVRLTQPADHPVVVTYSVESMNGNADSRDKATDDDVVFKNGNVTIHQGQLQALIPVVIKGDNTWETNEVFQVRVGSAPGVGFAKPVGIMTIVDDDLENLVDSIIDALEPSDRAIVWFDFQNANNVFDASADVASAYVAATHMTHSRGMQSAGTAGLPEDAGVGRAASSNAWANPPGYFEFTITLDHDDPLNAFFDHLQFWDKTVPNQFNPRFTGKQQWEIFTSLDGFETPLTRVQSIQVNDDFFEQNNLPDETELDHLLGWRRQRFLIDSDQEGYISERPLDVTFRMFGEFDVTSIIDNVELAGKVTAPCISGTEFSCLGRIVEDTQRFEDSKLGPWDMYLDGPGSMLTDLKNIGDAIDPTRFQEHLFTEIVGADPDRTTIRIVAERPELFVRGGYLNLGTIRSQNGLFRIDVSGVPAIGMQLETDGPLREFAVSGLADGSQVKIGGSNADVTTITSTVGIGSAAGIGVDLRSSSTVAFAGKSWMNGNWDVAAVTEVEVTGGDFSPAVSILGGFDSFTVTDGNFASPSFASGVGAAQHDGHGNRILAKTGSQGMGGSILVGLMTLDGNLTSLEATGGKINANVHAASMGTIRATRNSRSGDAGNIEGRYEAHAMDLVQSVGGNIISTLVTLDTAHRDLRVEAFADPAYPNSGRIISRRSFHIAGRVEAIRAHDMALRLVAGDRVELVELIGEGGSFQADLTARSFGLIQGRAAEVDLDLRTLPSEQPPPAGSMIWEIVPGPPSALLAFQIAELERWAGLRFTVDENGQPLLVELERLTPALVDENVSGGVIGPIGVPSSWHGEPLTILISDPRFELRHGQLTLKVPEYLQANLLGGELVDVSARTADDVSRWSETFVVSIDDNPFPWHNKLRPVDTNGDDSVMPFDALSDHQLSQCRNATHTPRCPPGGRQRSGDLVRCRRGRHR